MSTVKVVYVGRCEAVVSPDGALFPNGVPVEVPVEIAESLGSDFRSESIHEESVS